jgi:hypothetical protein
MENHPEPILPEGLLSDLEQNYFWWEPVGSEPRSPRRIIAQAMSLAGFEDIVRLEREVGPDLLADVMLKAEPGWIDARSWEFWRGRLSNVTGRDIPAEPPVRSFHAGAV